MSASKQQRPARRACTFFRSRSNVSHDGSDVYELAGQVQTPRSNLTLSLPKVLLEDAPALIGLDDSPQGAVLHAALLGRRMDVGKKAKKAQV